MMLNGIKKNNKLKVEYKAYEKQPVSNMNLNLNFSNMYFFVNPNTLTEIYI